AISASGDESTGRPLQRARNLISLRGSPALNNLAAASCSSQRCSSFFEDRQVKLAKTCGIAHDINLGDLPVLKRELQHPQQPSTRSEDESYRSINEHRLRESGTS